MAVDVSEQQDNSGGVGLLTIVEEHGPLFLAVGVVVALLLVYRFIKGQNGGASTTTNSTGSSVSDLSGLQKDANGNPIVYVPTSTEFYTDNSVNATSADGAPATIGPVNSPTTTINAPVTSTTTTTVGVQPPGVPVTSGPSGIFPVRQPPITPPPASHPGALQWDQTYAVTGGETLTAIAAEITARVRQQGAPSTVIVSYQQIYSHNMVVIDNTAKAHGNPIKGGPQNNIFPGEIISVPRWVKG